MAVWRRDAVFGKGDDTLAGAHEVNFHEVGVRLENFVLFLQIKSLSFSACFIGRAEKFDHGDHSSAGAFADFYVAFGHGFVFEEEHHWLGHHDATGLMESGWSRAARMVLSHVKVGNNAPNLLRFGFDENAFLDAGAKVGG